MDHAASRALAGLAALCCLAAGGEPGEVELRSATPRHTIIGGEPTEPGEFDGVVAVQAGTGLCSGTVVAPRLILTAAHCLADLEPGEEVLVHFGDQIDDGTVATTRWGAHPRFCPDCDGDLFDYGYVELGTDFTLPGGYTLPIATQAEWDEAMAKGTEVILVGYGEDPGSATGAVGIGTKRKVWTTIRRFSDGGLEFYAGGDQQDTCNGDSGGPAFVQVATGELRLAGITSRGSNPCGNGGYYGAPYPALCWVRDQTGVDFVGDACASCTCLDTSPPGDGSDCAIAAPGEHGDPSWLLVLLAMPLGPRALRRRPVARATG